MPQELESQTLSERIDALGELVVLERRKEVASGVVVDEQEAFWTKSQQPSEEFGGVNIDVGTDPSFYQAEVPHLAVTMDTDKAKPLPSVVS